MSVTDKQTLSTVSQFLSDFSSGVKTEANKRAQDFLKALPDNERVRFLAFTLAVSSVTMAHDTLSMAAAYLVDSKGILVGQGLPFALAETLTALVNGYNNGETLSDEGVSWSYGLHLLGVTCPSLMTDLILEENKELEAAFFDCLEGKIEALKVK